MGEHFKNNLISMFQFLANQILLQIFLENPTVSKMPATNYIKTLEIVIINCTPYVPDHRMLSCLFLWKLLAFWYIPIFVFGL